MDLKQLLNKDISTIFKKKSNIPTDGITEDETKGYLSDTPVYAANTCGNPDSLNHIDVLTIADCHGTLMQHEIGEAYVKAKVPDLFEPPWVVFLLGDNSYEDIETVLSYIPERIPIFGVLGNHDTKTLYDDFNRITSLDKMVIDWNGFDFGGLSGSVKYKDDDYYALISNEDSIKAMNELSPCDVLVTHDRPRFIEKQNEDIIHSGLTGIGNFIKQRKTKIVLHGHLHDRSIVRYNNIFIKCCYRAERFLIHV